MIGRILSLYAKAKIRRSFINVFTLHSSLPSFQKKMCQMESETISPMEVPVIIVTEECCEDSGDWVSAPPHQTPHLLCLPETSSEENPWQSLPTRTERSLFFTELYQH